MHAPEKREVSIVKAAKDGGVCDGGGGSGLERCLEAQLWQCAGALSEGAAVAVGWSVV